MTSKSPKTKPIDGLLVADVAMSDSLNSGLIVEKYGQIGQFQEHLNFNGIGTELERIAADIKDGDLSRIEAMLVGQAIAMQSIFTNLATHALSFKTQKRYHILLDLAMKAQNASRKTIDSLVGLKFPRQTTFVKSQSNIANGPQQVNNGIPSPAKPVFLPECESAVPRLASAAPEVLTVRVKQPKRGEPVHARVGKINRLKKNVLAKQTNSGH